MNILRLMAELGLNAAPFNKEIEKTKSQSKSHGLEIGAQFKHAFAHALGAAALIHQLHAVSEEVNKISDGSKRLELTVEQFQLLTLAANRAGQELQGGKGIGKVFNELAELRGKAEGGDAKAMKSLQDLGLSMLGVADSSETMFDAFNKVIHLSDSKLAEVFGGRVLLDIKAYREELEQIGQIDFFTSEQIHKIKEVNNEIASLKRSTQISLATLLTNPLEAIRNLPFGKGEGEARAKQLTDDFAAAFTKAIGGAVTSGIKGEGPDPNAAARARAAARINQQISDLLFGAKPGGQDLSRAITSTAASFGAQAALIGTIGAVEKPKPLNPELRAKLDELMTLQRQLVNQGKDTIKVGR